MEWLWNESEFQEPDWMDGHSIYQDAKIWGGGDRDGQASWVMSSGDMEDFQVGMSGRLLGSESEDRGG